MIRCILEAKTCFLQNKTNGEMTKVDAILIEDTKNNRQILIPEMNEDITNSDKYEIFISESKTKVKNLFRNNIFFEIEEK